MKKNLTFNMIMGMAAMTSSLTAEPLQVTSQDYQFGTTNLVSGRFGFRIPMNIPNQRQRRLNERRNPSLRKKKRK